MIEKPIITAEEAAALVHDGDSIMVGGFLAVGAPETIIDALVKANPRQLDLIVIATDYENRGVGKLISNHQIRHITTSHIGTNPVTQQQYIQHETEITFVPQGTFSEAVRAAGVGLGGFLTPTGVGTVVAEHKTVLEIQGKSYILQEPIRGRVALIHARRADRFGNLQFHGTSFNTNPLMGMAAEITIAEVDEIVEIGAIDPDFVHLPGIFVHYLVKTR
ncbi:MAG: CoA transferase subunit A [Candidatus Delongbacteria bacterium]|nr:CoA transferase subunit A [Candidatus Delongbacteria bacterium]